ncbi:MAG: L-rhamnose mutarotase [Barnesiella sp.]|nr:L-rhamnose mutarotase [Barnesiella sp.]
MHSGYIINRSNGPATTKRYCRTLNLRDNPELIAEYRRRHAEGNIWPEVIEGIRSVGILEMEIYILGTRLFMIVETPADFDWDSAMERLATLPRQAEWELFMSNFQDTDKENAASTDKWQMMERMFYLYE